MARVRYMYSDFDHYCVWWMFKIFHASLLNWDYFTKCMGILFCTKWHVCVPAFDLRTIPVMNFIPVFNYYATFRVKLVMVFIQDICDISKISKNCNCDIWMGRSTGNNGFIIFMHIHEMSCSDLRFNFKVNQVVFIINK